MKLDEFGEPIRSPDGPFSKAHVVCRRTRQGLGEIKQVLRDEAGRPRFFELETSDGRTVLFAADQVEPDPDKGIVWALNWAESREGDDEDDG